VLTFDDFKTGYRLLIMLHRKKDGGHGRADYHSIKYLVNGKEEFDEKLKRLQDAKATHSDIPYRIYSSINERDMDKAIRKFKYEIIDNDYVDKIQRNRFYTDINNRLIGCVQKPENKKTKNFLFDVDEGTHYKTDKDVELFCQHLLFYTNILFKKKTKNGWHIITEPFNVSELDYKIGDLLKDALLFIE